MKVNILNGWEVGMVDVPEGATHYSLSEWQGISYLFFNTGFDTSLPPGSWSILGPGTASQCSEEDAKGIVEKGYFAGKFCGYPSYQTQSLYYSYALESLHSYIRANGKEPGNIVIVYRKKN